MLGVACNGATGGPENRQASHSGKSESTCVFHGISFIEVRERGCGGSHIRPKTFCTLHGLWIGEAGSTPCATSSRGNLCEVSACACHGDCANRDGSATGPMHPALHRTPRQWPS